MNDDPLKSVDVDARGLLVDGALVARRQEIRSAVLSERDQPGPSIWVHRRFGWPLTVAVSSPQRGRQILTRLGFNASQRVATFPSPTYLGWLVASVSALVLVGGFATGKGVPAFAILVSFLGPVFLLIRFTGRTRVVVGADGVLVDGRCIPYEGITDASTWNVKDDEGHGRHYVGVSTNSGQRFTLWTFGDLRDSLAIVDRIHQALEGYSQSDPADRQDELSRNGLSVPAWIAHARSLNLAKEGTYRTAPRDETRWLWRAVEDVRAKPEARATAAMALP